MPSAPIDRFHGSVDFDCNGFLRNALSLITNPQVLGILAF
jgi:hypothetical protein